MFPFKSKSLRKAIYNRCLLETIFPHVVSRRELQFIVIACFIFSYPNPSLLLFQAQEVGNLMEVPREQQGGILDVIFYITIFVAYALFRMHQTQTSSAYILGLFNDVSKSSDYIESSDQRIMNWPRYGRKSLCPKRYLRYLGILLRALRKITKHLGKDSCFRDEI